LKMCHCAIDEERRLDAARAALERDVRAVGADGR
jgi:hypothetical protein